MMNPNITVSVRTHYLSSRSDPAQNYYVFSYTIRIENHGSSRVQLLTRHWEITDANNEVRTVDGRGVVGEEPFIAPTEHFEYTSVAILSTPVGSMAGFYTLQTDTGHQFTTPIPAFGLANRALLH